MKKNILFCIVLISMLFLVACSAADGEDSATNEIKNEMQTDETQVSEAETSESGAETAEVGRQEYTVEETEEPKTAKPETSQENTELPEITASDTEETSEAVPMPILPAISLPAGTQLCPDFWSEGSGIYWKIESDRGEWVNKYPDLAPNLVSDKAYRDGWLEVRQREDVPWDGFRAPSMPINHSELLEAEQLDENLWLEVMLYEIYANIAIAEYDIPEDERDKLFWCIARYDEEEECLWFLFLDKSLFEKDEVLKIAETFG